MRLYKQAAQLSRALYLSNPHTGAPAIFAGSALFIRLWLSNTKSNFSCRKLVFRRPISCQVSLLPNRLRHCRQLRVWIFFTKGCSRAISANPASHNQCNSISGRQTDKSFTAGKVWIKSPILDMRTNNTFIALSPDSFCTTLACFT